MQKILEVAIGLVLVFAIFSVLVSSITEAISGIVGRRAKDLELGLARMLDGDATPGAVTSVVLDHPLITSLSKGNRKPSYIDAVTFTTAFLDATSPSTTTGGGSTDNLNTDLAAGGAEFRSALGNLPDPVSTSLIAIWDEADADVTTFRHAVEDWFDRQMQRVSGWYGKRAQWWMFFIALFLAASMNVSGTTVARSLWAEPALRESTTQTATDAVNDTSDKAPTYDDLTDLGLPIGWTATAWPGLSWALVLHLLGVVVVAIAGSFGAPVWFDLLNKLVNLRMSGPKPEAAVEQRAP